MNQHEFDKLLEKYLAGECDSEEEILILNWQENMLKSSQLLLSSDEKAAIKDRLWSRIYTDTVGKGKSVSIPKTTIFWIKWAIAASVLLAIVNVFLLTSDKNIPQIISKYANVLSGDIEIKNTSNITRNVTLEDGTVVMLKDNSSLSYPEHFGTAKRDVVLKGEAFFKVKRDPSKPFMVHTGDLVTEVLGTSFTVKSYDESKAIEVSVTSGRVSVYENSDKSSDQRNGVILTPNQRMIFDKTSKKLIAGIVENPVLIVPVANKIEFIFEEAPLQQVLDKLRNVYGLEIIIENQALNSCVFTADLNELPLSTQLDLICKSVSAIYEQRGTSIFINGDGCR